MPAQAPKRRVLSTARSATPRRGWYTALCSVLPDDIPINSGVFRAVRISAPEGTVVNPLPPAPCMFSTVVIGGDIGTATMRALEQAIPDRAGAVSLNYCLCTTYGHDSRYDAMFVTIEYGNTLVAASGTRGSDGWGGWPAPMCGLIYSTVEMSEIQFPFFYHQYEYVADTAAAGQWRGVPGFAMKRESVRDESIIHVALTGVRHTAPGYAGGKDGASSRYVLNWGTEHEEEVLESAANRPSPPGSIIATFKGGGGGWGDPLRRDPPKGPGRCARRVPQRRTSRTGVRGGDRPRDAEPGYGGNHSAAGAPGEVSAGGGMKRACTPAALARRLLASDVFSVVEALARKSGVRSEPRPRLDTVLCRA